MRRLVKWLVVIASLVSPMLVAAPSNVLIIVADDLGYADVGFNGGKVIATLVAKGSNNA